MSKRAKNDLLQYGCIMELWLKLEVCQVKTVSLEIKDLRHYNCVIMLDGEASVGKI